MLGLYLYALIIGYKSCNILSTCILNKLTFQRKLQTFVTNNVFWTKKVKKQQQQNKNIKRKSTCRSRELNPEPLAPKRMRYLFTTESTESNNDGSQAIKMFRRNGSKRK